MVRVDLKPMLVDMKAKLAEFLVGLLKDFIRQVAMSLTTWLLATLREKWREKWHERYDRKRAEQEEAARERQHAEDAGDAEAAKAAKAREAAAAREADFVRDFGTAGEEIIDSVAAKTPQAVDEAIDAATDRSKKTIAALGKEGTGWPLIGRGGAA